MTWAAANGHEQVVKLLLEKGAIADNKDTKSGKTPLSCAASNGHKSVVKLLLEKGVEVDSKDTKFRRTPMTWVAANGHEPVVKLLLEKGAIPSPATIMHFSALAFLGIQKSTKSSN